jgi:hypothetical protein
VQYFGAVYWGNSRVDKLVTGLLNLKLKAYTGKGREYSKGGSSVGNKSIPPRTVMRFIPPEHLEIKQICIPGMSDLYDDHTHCYEKAFQVINVEDIWSSKHFMKP